MDDLLRQIEAALPSDVPQHLGVAVSGGSDSIAMLTLLFRLSQARGFGVAAVTVDHGLRAEASEEAQAVAQYAAQLSIPHDTLVWTGWDGKGNTQNEARKARYALMADWAKANGVQAIALGHTLDDQAETVVMRLARGAGVDGLSAMRCDVDREGLRWLRPLLGIRREQLQVFLRDQGVSWLDDPSNEDMRFERVKTRETLALLEPLGVTAEALGQVAQNMQFARDALEAETHVVARRLVSVQAGALKVERAAFEALQPEIARRLVVAALQWIAGAEYAPRARSVASALNALRMDGSATLEGCRLLRKSDSLWIFREYNAVKEQRCAPDALWDGRWILTGPGLQTPLTIAALGHEGLAQCPDWRDTGLPRDLLMACPAIWAGNTLCAAPYAGKGSEWSATLQKGDGSFFRSLISH